MNGHSEQDIIDYTQGEHMESMQLAHPLTGEMVEAEDLNAVVEMWRDVKDHISQLYDLKNELEQIITFNVEQPEDSNTAHLETPAGHVKVEFRTTEKWEKKSIQAAAHILPDLVDNLKISGVYKRYLKKLENTTFTEPEKEQAKKLIFDARSEQLAKPYISLEANDD